MSSYFSIVTHLVYFPKESISLIRVFVPVWTVNIRTALQEFIAKTFI